MQIEIIDIVSTLIESGLIIGLGAAMWKKQSGTVKENSVDISNIQKDYITKDDLKSHKESVDDRIKNQENHIENRLKEHKKDWQRGFDQLLEMLGKNNEKTDEIFKMMIKDRREE